MSLFARLAHYSSEPQFIDVLVLNYMKLHQNLCKHPPVQDVHVGYKLEIVEHSGPQWTADIHPINDEVGGARMKPYHGKKVVWHQTLPFNK